MITIIPDDPSSKWPSDQKDQTEEPQVALDEPPPSYSARTVSGSTRVSLLPTSKTKPTNFLALSTKDSAIRGEFVIDPSIRIPSSMLPPLGDSETEDDRKNLSLSSKHSSVHADIWLLPGPSSPSESTIGAHEPRRTTIALTSDHGSIRAQLHTVRGAAPFSLTGRTSHGGVRLALPRSFHGTIALSTRHGRVSLSDALVENATQLGQRDDARRYFVGDFRALGEGRWEGDRVEVEAPHGSIRVRYVDEGAGARGKKGLLSRLFGK